MFRKFLIYGVSAGALLLGASLLTTKTFQAEIMISAPPEKIWSVLMETGSYPDWNPTVVEVKGQYKVGARLPTKVKDPAGEILEMTNTVITLSPNRELRQTGGTFGIITFDHQWLLEPVQGGTKVTQYEVDRGALLWFWNSDWIEPAYLKASEALAKRVSEIEN
ncbi:MAG: SRPBCC domain-containing protein [Sneathiellales bacterium]|nr:SRPBCC domain-containing protein [Sneathiellales bacterium]